MTGSEPLDGETGAVEAPDADAGWRHLSPLSPVVRLGLVTIAIVGFFIAQSAERIFNTIGGDFWSSRGSGSRESDPDLTAQVLANLWIAGGVLVLLLVVVGGGSWLSWRFSRFRVTEQQVEFRKGWLFREHRQVPIDRIQAVEIGRPLLAQVLRLAEVVVQSAGGSGSQLKIAFLPLAEAQELRLHIQRLAIRSDEVSHDNASDTPDPDASGEVPDSTSAARAGTLPGDLFGLGGAEGRTVVSVPNARLFAATMLHSSLFAVLGVVVLGVASSTLSGGRWGAFEVALASLPAMGPILLGIGISRVKELLKHGNFRLYDVGSAVKIVHGLTDHRTTSIPLHRVQAMELRQSLWWRPFGWWRVRLNVAGAPKDEMDQAQETVVLPVGSLEDALAVLTLIDARLSTEVLTQAALGEGTEGGWTLVAPSAKWLDPWSWKRRGYAVSHHGILIRGGRLTRTVVSVPHARIQSLGVDQGPVERRLGLAGVRLVSTPGPISPRIDHLSLRGAESLLAEEAERASAARRLDEVAAVPTQVSMAASTTVPAGETAAAGALPPERAQSSPQPPGQSPYSGRAPSRASAEGDREQS